VAGGTPVGWLKVRFPWEVGRLVVRAQEISRESLKVLVDAFLPIPSRDFPE
jgi:hypothetical protein